MYQIQSQEQLQSQSPIKTQNGNCFKCSKPGHWAKDCPEYSTNRSPVSRSPITTFDPDYPSIHCRCGAGLCLIRVSSTAKNPGRKYYSCPAKYEKNCWYFMWCDNPRKEEISEIQPISFPICGCGAGVATLLTEEYGPNAGKKYWACHIKKGEGACSFKQWLDTAPQLSHTDEQNSNLNEFESNDGAKTQIDALQEGACELVSEDIQVQAQMEAHELPVLEDHEEMNEENDASNEAYNTYGVSTESVPSSFINLAGKTRLSDFPSQNSVILRMRMDDSTTEKVQAPVSALVAAFSQDAMLKCLIPYLKHDHGQPDKTSNSWGDNAISTLTSSITNPNKGSFSHQDPVMLVENKVREESFSPCGLFNDRSDEGCIMTSTISQEFDKLAHHLQNELVTLLESIDLHNHRIMMKEAKCTFAALDSLTVEYEPFRVRVTEYITQAEALSEIEQIIQNENASSQELMQRYKNEKSGFDEISRAYCQAIAAYAGSTERLSLLRETGFCLNDMLDELDTEISCCVAENAAYHDNMIRISKTLAESKERLQIACREAAEAKKISEKRGIERSAVKAAFEKAKAQLRM